MQTQTGKILEAIYHLSQVNRSGYYEISVETGINAETVKRIVDRKVAEGIVTRIHNNFHIANGWKP